MDFIDTDLDDSMYKNRSALKKNLPENNLASIIDLHKSNKYGQNNRFIQSEKNPFFEENLRKVNCFAVNNNEVYYDVCKMFFCFRSRQHQPICCQR